MCLPWCGFVVFGFGALVEAGSCDVRREKAFGGATGAGFTNDVSAGVSRDSTSLHSISRLWTEDVICRAICMKA